MKWLPRLGLVLAALIALLLALTAFLPSELVARYVSEDGKVEHALGLTLVALLVTASYPRAWALVLGLGVLASGVVELVQPIFGRGAQWSDFAADVAGLVIGIGVALSVIGLVRSYDRSS